MILTCRIKPLIRSALTRRPLSVMSTEYRPPPPCKVGDPVSSIDTPALVVEVSALQQNLQQMSTLMQRYPGVKVRPHVKAHKSPSLAQMQVSEHGSGVCCQTLVEAEAMVLAGGIADVFLTNQIIGHKKLTRLANLAKKSKISLCVDDVNNIRDLNTAAAAQGVVLDCVVEVNVGQERCGVEPGEPIIPLIKEIQGLPNVNFKGLHCYQGLNQHIRKTDDRQTAVNKVVEKVIKCKEVLASHDITCSYITGGGTGSFYYEAASGHYDEVQPGSYCLMDVDYSLNLAEDGENHNMDFKHSLYVLTTVQSVSAGTRAVVDAGMKAVSMDSGAPKLRDHPSLTYHCGGDEHGVVVPSGELKMGDTVLMIPGHCDPTVNLHDWLIGIEGGVVKALWPVLGRGPGV